MTARERAGLVQQLIIAELLAKPGRGPLARPHGPRAPARLAMPRELPTPRAIEPRTPEPR